MSFTKWIGAALGWSFGGPIGAIIGMALGSLVDGVSDSQPKIGPRPSQRRPSRSKRQAHPYQKQQPKTQSGDFEVSLLILASIVIKADGQQDERELFGNDFLKHGLWWFEVVLLFR